MTDTKKTIRFARELLGLLAKARVSEINPIEYILVVHALQEALNLKPICKACHCTEKRGCRGGCSWATPFLCTACAEAPDRWPQ